jgi:hypothetical protein
MLDLGRIIARLQDIEGYAHRVALSATIADALAVNIAQDGYLWLAGPNGLSERNELLGGAVHQERAQRFSIVSLVRNVRDPAGAGSLRDIAGLRQSVLDRLIGWIPDAGYGPIEHVRDASVSWDGARLYWADEFRTPHILRSL